MGGMLVIISEIINERKNPTLELNSYRKTLKGIVEESLKKSLNESREKSLRVTWEINEGILGRISKGILEQNLEEIPGESWKNLSLKKHKKDQWRNPGTNSDRDCGENRCSNPEKKTEKNPESPKRYQ